MCIRDRVWTEDRNGMEWGQSFSVCRNLGHCRRIAARAGVTGRTADPAGLQEYTLRVPYRQRLYRDWIYFEIEPGVDFPREENYRPCPLVIGRLKFMFGDSPPDGK